MIWINFSVLSEPRRASHASHRSNFLEILSSAAIYRQNALDFRRRAPHLSLRSRVRRHCDQPPSRGAASSSSPGRGLAIGSERRLLPVRSRRPTRAVLLFHLLNLPTEILGASLVK